MARRCHSCGYENRDDALLCNLCQALFRTANERPSAAPGRGMTPPPAAAGPAGSAASPGALDAAVRRAADALASGDGETGIAIARDLFLRGAAPALATVTEQVGRQWLDRTALPEGLRAGAHALITAAAAAVREEDEPEAMRLLTEAYHLTGDTGEAHKGLLVLLAGVRARTELIADEPAEARYAASRAEARSLAVAPGKRAEAILAYEALLALVPDPAVSPRDRGRREQIAQTLTMLRSL